MKKSISGLSKTLSYLGLFVLILGYFFWVLHWEFGPFTGRVLVVLGMVLLVSGIAVRIYNKERRTYMDWAILIYVVLLVLHYSFKIFHLPNQKILKYLLFAGMVNFCVAGLRQAFLAFRKGDSKATLGNIFYVLAAAGIGIGVIAKIFHIPYSDSFLFGGIAAVILAVIFNKTK